MTNSYFLRLQKPYFMAIEPEFVRLMKRWVPPTANNTDQQRTTTSTAPSTSGTKPIQLDDDEEDLR